MDTIVQNLGCQNNHSKRLPVSLAAVIFAISSLLFVSVDATNVLLSKAEIEKIGKRYGPQAKKRIIAWQRLFTELAPLPEKKKLEKVNNFFNQVRFVDDIRHWRKKDYWATPVEFLITNGGDCEDFSIAKYYTLKQLGVPINKMNLAYVKALRLNQAHMVLTYYSSSRAEPVVLDNLNGNILPASKRTDLLHVYSFNGDKLWLSKMGKRKLVGTSDRLKPWVKLQSRVENQDINLR